MEKQENNQNNSTKQKPPKMDYLEINVHKEGKKISEDEIDEIFEKKNEIPLIPFEKAPENNKNNEQEIKDEQSLDKQKVPEKQSDNKKNSKKDSVDDKKQVQDQDDDFEDVEDDDEEEEEEAEISEEFQKIIDDHQGIIYIDQKDAFIQMIKEINQNARNQVENVIGIDTEQSFQQTYQPYLSLIQISTLKADYIIDCLVLGKELIRNLKVIFQNKDIVKVFYGGQNDLVWLKRDYQLQVYNYCDIKILADQVWKNKNNSLVSLWEEICDHKMSKEEKKVLQVSEWSNRPLTKDQIKYAALDAHYLVYLRYYLLWDLLMEKGIDFIVEELYKMQKNILKEFEPRQFQEKAYLALAFKMLKINKVFNTFSTQIQDISKIFLVELARMREQLAIQQNQNVNNLMEDTDFALATAQLFYLDSKDAQFIKNYQKLQKSLLYTKHYEQIVELKRTIENNKEKYLQVLNQVDKKDKQLSIQHEKIQQKQERKEKIMKNSAVKSQPYENCQLQSPQGLTLCNCNKKKIDWYLKNNLGDIVCEDPLTLKLNFQPNGFTNEQLKQEVDLEDGYYTTHRENMCVICGSKQDFVKFHIVPPVYRSHFPDKFKSHRSHDILLLCQKCHTVTSAECDKKKEQIAKQYDIPLHQINSMHSILKKIKYFTQLAIAYKTHSQKQEKEQRKQHKQHLREIYSELLNIPDIQQDITFLKEDQILYNKEKQIKINQTFLDFATVFDKNLEKFQENKISRSKRNSHGQKIMEILNSDDLIIDFIKEWRQFFLDNMKPKYLPDSWNINHKFCRGFGEHSVFKNDEGQQISQQQQSNNQKIK